MEVLHGEGVGGGGGHQPSLLLLLVEQQVSLGEGGSRSIEGLLILLLLL